MPAFCGIYAQSVSALSASVADKEKQAEAEKERQMRREREIRTLVLSANTQPVEVSADILFKVLDSKLIKDIKERRDIVEDLFRRASEAKEPFKLAYYGGNVDTRPGYRSMSLREMDTDRLSIQLSAIRLMLTIDKLGARQMFRDIPDLRLPSQSCDEVLTYIVADYYKILLEIVNQTFDHEARQRNEHIYFAASYIESIESPSQVIPAIELLRSLKASPPEFEMLKSSLTDSFRKVQESPRGFALSLGGSMSALISMLVPKDPKARDAGSIQLLKAYRNYLVRQSTSEQCADALMIDKHGKPNGLIEFANELFEIPLSVDEVTPETVKPAPKVYHYWQRPKSKALLTNIKSLRFGKSENGLSIKDRSTPEWQQDVLQFLEKMEDWKVVDEETEADYLHQKSVLYNGLVQLVPPGTLHSNVLRSYALFLRDSRMQKESPGQWLYYAKLVLRTGGELKGKEQEEFMNILNNSGSPPFLVYSELGRLLSTGKPKEKLDKQ